MKLINFVGEKKILIYSSVNISSASLFSFLFFFTLIVFHILFLKSFFLAVFFSVTLLFLLSDSNHVRRRNKNSHTNTNRERESLRIEVELHARRSYLRLIAPRVAPPFLQVPIIRRPRSLPIA